MQKQSTNLAVISNNTLAANKVVNLHHYDMSSALQTSLDFNELITIFSSKIATMIPHSAYLYHNEEFHITIEHGVFTKHSIAYKLKIEQQGLGELTLMRNTRFSDAEIELLETLLCCLIYPLRNASLYNSAIKLAYTDTLTQTNNRAAFNDILQREIHLARRHGKELSLIFMDLDHFKAINDDYGHECGDFALKSVASKVKENLRTCDMMFRFGGEEFVLILSDTEAEGAKALAERLRLAIESQCLAYDMQVFKVTASFGVTSLRNDDCETQLIKRADHAMYQAKEQGRNTIVMA